MQFLGQLTTLAVGSNLMKVPIPGNNEGFNKIHTV
jgi:hypothetical protein